MNYNNIHHNHNNKTYLQKCQTLYIYRDFYPKIISSYIKKILIDQPNKAYNFAYNFGCDLFTFDRPNNTISKTIERLVLARIRGHNRVSEFQCISVRVSTSPFNGNCTAMYIE